MVPVGHPYRHRLAAILSAVSIFMYKNRIRQMRWVNNAMIFQLMASGTGVGVFFTLGRIGTHLTGEAIGLGLLVLAVLFQLMANASIKKDERLVKSMDRIR
jgi:ATP/ADP translocase